jgi:hypothetical protein
MLAVFTDAMVALYELQREPQWDGHTACFRCAKISHQWRAFAPVFLELAGSPAFCQAHPSQFWLLTVAGLLADLPLAADRMR